MTQFTSNTHKLAEKNLVHKAYQTPIEALQLDSQLTQILANGKIKTAGDFLFASTAPHHAVRASLDNVQTSRVFHALSARGLEEPILLSLVPYNHDTDNYGMAGVLERLDKKIPQNIPFGQHQPIAVVKHAISLLTDCEKTYFESKHRWDAEVVCDSQTAMIATANAIMNVDLHSQFWMEGNINIAVRIVQSIADITNGSYFITRANGRDILITPISTQHEGQ